MGGKDGENGWWAKNGGRGIREGRSGGKKGERSSDLPARSASEHPATILALTAARFPLNLPQMQARSVRGQPVWVICARPAACYGGEGGLVER